MTRQQTSTTHSLFKGDCLAGSGEPLPEPTDTNVQVLVVGSGGREFELGRSVYESGGVSKVYFLPGNAGTDQLPYGHNINGDPFDVPKDTFTIIGPEAPLVAGLADELRADGRLVFGPSARAAQLEASKAEAVGFNARHDIPQPISAVAEDLDAAYQYIGKYPPDSYVIKADGLANGKGVVLPRDLTEAMLTVRGMLDGSLYDGAGKKRIVFQERLTGPEVSLFVVSDGQDFTLLPLAQDHKRLLNGDKGPNTGGMGAYASANELLDADQLEKVYDIAQKSITGMAAEGTPYQGLLYIGLMMAKERGGDPVVIEYNCRFGDPETQVVLPLLTQNGVNVHRLLRSAAEGNLDIGSTATSLFHLGGAALSVCLAAPGYPDTPIKGARINGLDKDYQDVILHHAGTKTENDKIVTSGGRVLNVTGFGEDMVEAATRAYAAIGESAVNFEDMQYRTDIGHQLRIK